MPSVTVGPLTLDAVPTCEATWPHTGEECPDVALGIHDLAIGDTIIPAGGAGIEDGFAIGTRLVALRRYRAGDCADPWPVYRVDVIALP